MAAAAPDQQSVLVRFTASTPPELRDAHGVELSIPASAGRNALRKLLHHLIPYAAATRADLHILAAGEPLRTTLDSFITRRGLSREATLELVYYVPLPQPVARGSTKASADWLSAVAAHPTDPPTVLVGSFSGAPSLLQGADTLVSEDCLLPAAHHAPIKAVCWLPAGDAFVTASQDRCARVWAYDAAAHTATPGPTFRADDAAAPAGLCAADATEAADKAGGASVALGAEDGSVWVLPGVTAPHAGGGKRGAALPAVRVGGGALALPVSAVHWQGAGSVVSAGWDAVARDWDVERCEATRTIPCGGKPVTGLAAGAGAHVVAAVDGGVRLVDARDGGGVVGACGRRGAHAGVVSAVQWIECARSFVSGGFDGSARVWDVRAMHAPARVAERVLDGAKVMDVAAVACGGGHEIFCAGSNGRVARLAM